MDSLADKEDDEVIIVDRRINETVDLENDLESNYEETGIFFPATPTTAEARRMIDQLKAKFIAAFAEVPDCLLDVENRINHIPLRQATLNNWLIEPELIL